jgi:hypothetical protein
MTAEEGEKWGFFSRIVTPEQVLAQAQLLARQIADGPTFGNTMTKRMLAMEWAMSVEEAIEAEAVAQALCMTTEDFARAFEAFSNKRTPVSRVVRSEARDHCRWPAEIPDCAALHPGYALSPHGEEARQRCLEP